MKGFRSGAEEGRTPDLCIANAALSQLSYRPKTSSKCLSCNVFRFQILNLNERSRPQTFGTLSQAGLPSTATILHQADGPLQAPTRPMTARSEVRAAGRNSQDGGHDLGRLFPRVGRGRMFDIRSQLSREWDRCENQLRELIRLDLFSRLLFCADYPRRRTAYVLTL